MNLSNISIIYLNNIQNETERSKLGTVNQKKIQVLFTDRVSSDLIFNKKIIEKIVFVYKHISTLINRITVII